MLLAIQTVCRSRNYRRARGTGPVALVGVLIYVVHYRELAKDSDTHDWVITTNTLMICLYNLLIGYLIASIPRPGLGIYLLCALAVHSLAVGYVRRTFGLLDEIVAYVTAFLSGAIIANALSEEPPTQEGTRLPEFFLGAALFCVIAVFIYSLPVIIE